MRRRRRARASRGLDLASARSWTREGEDVATRARTSNARAGDATDARRDARARCDETIRRLASRATRAGRWGTAWGVVIGGLVVGRTGGRSDRVDRGGGWF